MALDVRKFGPKSDKIGAHRGAFVYQEPFKKDSSTASRVINEVVLGSWLNKGGARSGAPDQELRVSSLLMSLNSNSGMPMETTSKTTSLKAASCHGTTPGSCDPLS